MDINTQNNLYLMLKKIRRSDIGKRGLSYCLVRYIDNKWEYTSRCFTKETSEIMFNKDRTENSFIVLGYDEAKRICEILNKRNENSKISK